MIYEEKPLRHEKKYIIKYIEYMMLRGRIKGLLKTDLHSDGEYNVTSLYFDTRDRENYYDNEMGLFKRHKYRIRIYDKCDSYISLEKKSKFGEYTSKERCVIDRDTCENIVSGKRVAPNPSKPLLNAFIAEKNAKGLIPSVMVSYDREAYALPAGNLRITFDKNLSFSSRKNSLFDKDAKEYSVFKNDDVIMEIKYDDFLPDFVKDLLTIGHFRTGIISKYTMCIDAEKSHFIYQKII